VGKVMTGHRKILAGIGNRAHLGKGLHNMGFIGHRTSKPRGARKKPHTHTHTHTHLYCYKTDEAKREPVTPRVTNNRRPEVAERRTPVAGWRAACAKESER